MANTALRAYHVELDQQHGLADGAALAGVFRAIEVHGAAPTTRVPANDFAEIGKALDVGAVAIVVPMVGTVGGSRAGRHGVSLPASRDPLRGPPAGAAGPGVEAARGAR